MDIKLDLPYYASIMLDTFKDPLCSKLCWHNRPGPILNFCTICMHALWFRASPIHACTYLYSQHACDYVIILLQLIQMIGLHVAIVGYSYTVQLVSYMASYVATRLARCTCSWIDSKLQSHACTCNSWDTLSMHNTSAHIELTIYACMIIESPNFIVQSLNYQRKIIITNGYYMTPVHIKGHLPPVTPNNKSCQVPLQKNM